MRRDEGEGARGRENRVSRGCAGAAESECNVSSGPDQRCEGHSGNKVGEADGMDPIVVGTGGAWNAVFRTLGFTL